MTIPYFRADKFDDITDPMRSAFQRDGVLVLEDMIAPTECDALMARMAEIMTGFDYASHRTVFSADGNMEARDAYFLDSGNDIRFFFEDGALDDDGSLLCAPDLALNKVGHALHELDPVFREFSNKEAFRKVTGGLGMASPRLLQSMYIFKQPHIGGEVACHQDSSYLRTTPQTCIGLWVALEDATLENGCLWGIAGEHGGEQPKSIFRRIEGGMTTENVTLDPSPFPEEKKQPLEVKKGTLVVLHGLFPHMSGPNTSGISRHAYAIHLVDREAEYPADNWLQPGGVGASA